MEQIEAAPIGTVRVWDRKAHLTLSRPIKKGDVPLTVAHHAVSAARLLPDQDPRHVTIDMGGDRMVRTVVNEKLVDPKELLHHVEWPSNPLLD